MQRLQIVKTGHNLYSCILLSLKGDVLWETDEPLSANEIGMYLSSTYGIHQLDVFDKLSKADPKRFYVQLTSELDEAQKILNDDVDNTVSPILVKTLRSWLTKQKNSNG